jgi:hypothetical protein
MQQADTASDVLQRVAGTVQSSRIQTSLDRGMASFYTYDEVWLCPLGFEIDSVDKFVQPSFTLKCQN